ncbi:unnamed protein product [Heligmosomoides polygyrus]|uniref:Uncharacterized protein n=1 Tax=Heligmosomoides polygyrus TaxID=6339 RepID=A0A183G1U9_HELPZ|nr:unnamed protein product [Heligmosomoides polygyrus]
MQRLHGWLDQLTLRRSRRREALSCRRNISQSVAPSCRLNLESKPAKHELRPVHVPVVSPAGGAPMMVGKPETGSFARRRGIRTNPWLYSDSSLTRHGGSFRGDATMAQSWDRRCVPPTLLGVKSLEESTCSSGYGSQDCSPDSSVHLSSWQTASSPFADEHVDDACYLEETSSFSTYDNVCDDDDDKHIYHELELCCRVPERSYSSEQLSSLDDSRSSSPIYACPDSPIYAQPWTHYQMVPERRAPSIILAKRAPAVKPLTVRNQSFKRVLPEIHSDYATPYAVSSPITSYLEKSNSLVYPGSYFSRVSVTAAVEKPATMEETEEEFLTELDAQIAELQLRSDELRLIVEKARLKRNVNWLRPPMECTFELSI